MLEPMDKPTTLAHTEFPYHQAKVKKTEFCDPAVKFVHHFFERNPRDLLRRKVHMRDTST
jgi:hypothetical protein